MDLFTSFSLQLTPSITSIMDNTKSPQKFVKNGSQCAVQYTSTRAVKSVSPQQSTPKTNYWVPLTKETTKPVDFKLHTKERAIKRAIFNYTAATKLYIIEQQKKQVERIQRIIEEEEVRMLRKEMIPRAQLMPIFDRPFFPQRSTRPLTRPREPSFHLMGSNSLSCCHDLYSLQHNEAH